MNLGWIKFEDRTPEQHAAHEAALAKMPVFALSGPTFDTPPKVLLSDSWSHPIITQALGQPFTGFKQYSGACVGVGGGDAFQSLANLQAIKDPTYKPVLIWWPLTYGRGRLAAGMHGQGEGSMGASEAQAAKEDGLMAADFPGLPQFKIDDGMFALSEQIEMQWSDGEQIPAADLAESRQHLVKIVSPLDNSQAVDDSIRNGYPVTIACSMFVNPNSSSVRGSKEPALVGVLNGSGGHQESIQGTWKHPELGRLFFLMNQWGQSVYSTDPAGGPRGGNWITEKAMDWICERGEVYAFGSLDQWRTQQLNYLLG